MSDHFSSFPLSNVFEEWQEIKETQLVLCQNHVMIFQVFYYLFCDQLNTFLCKHSLICNSLPLPWSISKKHSIYYSSMEAGYKQLLMMDAISSITSLVTTLGLQGVDRLDFVILLSNICHLFPAHFSIPLPIFTARKRTHLSHCILYWNINGSTSPGIWELLVYVVIQGVLFCRLTIFSVY